MSIALATAPDTAPPQRSRVLLVDDEAALRRILRRFLELEGYDVTEAADGEEAREHVASTRFDAVVSDVNMPGIDGVRLVREVRERDLDLPIILLTGAPDLNSAIGAVENGAFKYLVKPVEPDRLIKAVGNACRTRKLADLKRAALDLQGDESGPADRLGLELSFGRAMESLWVAFQPIVRVSDRSLYGYEALLRTREPSLPHPGAVIDAARRLDRLNELGQAVRYLAAKAMRDAPADAILFVNLHASDLEDDTLISEFSPLASLGHRVVLEITERSSVDEIRDLATRVADLRRMGHRIAIDDLGAGYSGLNSFAIFEPEIVKLDMSLVRGIHLSETKRRIIRSMRQLCSEMGILVVAEGVETVEERDALVELGCDLLQGYLLAKPGPAFPAFSWA